MTQNHANKTSIDPESTEISSSDSTDELARDHQLNQLGAQPTQLVASTMSREVELTPSASGDNLEPLVAADSKKKKKMMKKKKKMEKKHKEWKKGKKHKKVSAASISVRFGFRNVGLLCSLAECSTNHF